MAMSPEDPRPAPTYRAGMPGYVLRDWEVIDYECYRLDGTDLWFRGPAPPALEPGRYGTVIGAAQTFGCFTPRPYPAILSERLETPLLNLGYSGAGPGFFLRHPELIHYINQGRFCIVQAMSARSTSNSLLENPDGLAYGRRRRDGRPTAAEDVLAELVADRLRRVPIPGDRAKRAALRLTAIPLPAVRAVVRESRRNWLEGYAELMDAITVPTVFLWFSTRTPRYLPRYHRASHVMGEFPHMVTSSMVRTVARSADRYVECTSVRGHPQPLFSRFTGDPTTVDLSTDVKEVGAHGDGGEDGRLYEGVWEANIYYPSPEMHEDAADALEGVCRRLAAQAPHRSRSLS